MAVRLSFRGATKLRTGNDGIAIDNQGYRPSPVRALVLSAAGDVNLGVSYESCKRAAHKGPRVAGRRNIGIVEHSVAVTAQSAVMAGLRLGKHNEPLAIGR